MLKSQLLGAACTLFTASLATAQITDGSMSFTIAGGSWVLQSCSQTNEVTDPYGLITVDGSRLDTFARANGDMCKGTGEAKDTVAGGARYEQTSAAEGYHVCSLIYLASPQNPEGEVEIIQDAEIEGQVDLLNQHAVGAALGYCRASSTAGTLAEAVLDDSVAETVSGAIGDLSQAYCGESYTPNVQLGNGLFTDSDAEQSVNVVCQNSLVVEHRSCAFVRVGAARIAASAGPARSRVSMDGTCSTTAFLFVCPE